MKKPSARHGMTVEQKKIILASSVGTVFEWYDFFLYGALTTIIASQFFANFSEATRNIFALLAFAVGFLVRPLGGLLFGRLGDLIGRKHIFLATLVIMGLATFLVAFLPTYATWGMAAPIALLCLRVLQGLAIGGEYGGAAIYVAEHAPHNRRGFFVSFINSTATLGLLLALAVILLTRLSVGEQAFADWGWRVPFGLSIVLLALSIYMRIKLQETPAYAKIKQEGRQSKAPLREAFGSIQNLKFAFVIFIGISSGLAVIFYTTHFYTLFFLQSVLRVDMFTANVLVAWSLVIGFASYVLSGCLSDSIGRKPVMLAGFLLGMIAIFPAYDVITRHANPQLYAAQQSTNVQLISDRFSCLLQFNPVGTQSYVSDCDRAKTFLIKNAVNFDVIYEEYAPVRIEINQHRFHSAMPDAEKRTMLFSKDPQYQNTDAFMQKVAQALYDAGYPKPGVENSQIVKLNHVFDVFRPQVLKLLGVMSLLVAIAAMASAPTAAAMAELFPTRIRYTGMSLPYNLGIGWFGGLAPATAYAISTHTGHIYNGLWYTVIVLGLSSLSVLFLLPERYKADILSDD